MRFRYPFWVENAHLAARNTEPFPYGYGTLDVVLDGCPLQDVAFSVRPDTQSWLPRPVDVGDPRFQYEHTGRSVDGRAPSFLGVEFRTADELREKLHNALGEDWCPAHAESQPHQG